MTLPPDVQAVPQDDGEPLAILLLDADGSVIAWNEAMTDLLGFTPTHGQPLAGQPDLTADRPGPPGPTLQGRFGPIPCQATTLAGDRPATLLCPLHQLSRAVLDALPVDLAILNAQGAYLYANPAAIRNPEIRRGIIGLTDPEYIEWRGHPPERASVRMAHFQQAVRSGQQVQFVETFHGPTTRYLARSYLPLRTADGTLQLMLGYGEDHTRDRTHEDQQRLLRTMVDTSADPLLVINARPGAQYQCVEYANPAMLELLRQHGLEGLPDTPMPQWPMADGNTANILAVLGRLEHLPVGTTHRDTLFLPEMQQWLEINVTSILDGNATCSHWAVNLRDVTRQRSTEIWRERIGQAHRAALAGAPLSRTVTSLIEHADPWEFGWEIGVVVASDPPLIIGALPGPVSQALQAFTLDALVTHWCDVDPTQQGNAIVTADLTRPSSECPLYTALAAHSRSLIELPLYGRDSQLLGAIIATHHAPHTWTWGVAEILSTLTTTVAMLVEQHLNKDRLERLAYRDPLTGLLNRSALTDWTTSAIRSGQPLALGLMDVNRFRFLNDGFGHEVGDQLLAELAQRLRGVAERGHLQALARMGGDEFGLLAHPDQLSAIVPDLRKIFEQPFEVRGNLLLLEATVGWSLAPATAQDAQTLLQQADSALYEAKRTQLFSQVFQPAPPTRVPTVTLESALRESLRDGHFRMVYQPQVHLDTCVLVGAEALLRWTHPTLGPVPPDQFIPVAELAGLMPRLGEWVLTAACREAAAWTNPHLTVSVNVSSRQLSDPNFTGRVQQALSSSALHPSRLVLEVTESGLIDNPTRVREVLQELRNLGVRVSMDDFGTGYSSLFSLRSLPVDELKIDRAFVRDLGQDTQAARESQAIVMASVLMARSLGIELLAEGVETEEQARALRDAGCDLGQGWLYARPLERDAFDTFELGWKARLLGPRQKLVRGTERPHGVRANTQA